MSEIRETPVPYRIWGEDQIEPGALAQMKAAAELPISVQGALMPDAHQGYGLPIGGVLATEGALIPYAVGVDIACRVKLTVFDASPHVLGQKREKFRQIIEENTVFGAGVGFSQREGHAVMDDPVFGTLDIARQYKDTAWKQLGSSGSGNHFVEFGQLTVHTPIAGTGDLEGEGSRTFGAIPPGKYLALLSHSGSRGLGFNIANHYTQIAMSLHPDLPKAHRHLAWLDIQSAEGQEYWLAMNLAGRYASANHAVIHRRIIDAVRFDVLGGIENHHNFAWKEVHDGNEVFIHRKGATPAGKGVYGVIPGTMMDPGFVVLGKGEPASLTSAAHGAGRQMSRGQAFRRFDWENVDRQLKRAGVDLLSAGLDESPGAYKDIHTVMAAQADLVEAVGEFQPLLVKMDADKKSRQRKSERSGSPDRKRYKESKKDKRRKNR
ncbi:MAG: RtcB family protein [Chloroflexi bacterium]|nr:RtcB family protein [Chloroflexota bacterium]